MSTTNLNPTSPTQESAGHFSEGQNLAGCYLLVRRLITGEQSEVWAAHDEVLGKDVCLHFIPEAVRGDARAMTELRQEIKRCRLLIHPNILRVYDVIEEPDWAAISTDTFEGDSLAVLLQKQPDKRFPAERVQPWIEQVVQTLEEAHKINVLHRDLVPANLFVVPMGKILVANFGVSRIIQDALHRAGLGDASHIALTSPQTAAGQATTKADDVYSVGALLYQMLTGRAQPGDTPEALGALKNEKLAVPVAWQEAVASCLRKNPESRPASISEITQLMSAERPRGTAKLPEPAPTAAPVAAKVEPEPTRPESVAPAREPKRTKAARMVQPELEVSKPEPVAPAPERESVAAESTATAREVESAKAEPEIVKAPAVEKPAPEPAPVPPKKETESSWSFPPAPARAPAPRKPATEFSPRMYPEGPTFPFKGVAIAAALILIVAAVYFFANSNKTSHEQGRTDATPPPEQGGVSVVNNVEPTPPTVPPSSDPATQPGAASAVAAGGAASKEQPPVPEVSPAPQGPDKVLLEKTANLEKAKLASQAAEKAHADLLKQEQQADVEAAEMRKLVDDKAKAVEPMKKAADEMAAKRKKLEGDHKAAELAAAEAQKAAAEKARLAEEAKMAIAEAEKANQELLASQQKANAELEELKNSLAQKQRMVADAAKVTGDADAERQKQLAAVATAEQEIEATKMAAAAAQKQRENEEAERRKVEQELADMKKAFADRMAELEARRQNLNNPQAAKPPTTPAPLPSLAPLPQAATPEPMKLASLPTTPAPSATPTPIAPPETGEVNSLGQKFVSVGDVAFCTWLTRVKDFEVFAKAVNLKSTSWKGPGFKQAPDHPVVNVTWQEAVAFCKWLTDKERAEGKLPANQFYRLPMDLEWSKAVGLVEEKGNTPEARDMGVPDVYPWGTAWPPPKGAGNYTGEETGSDVAIRGYDDGFAWTAPVGSFPPNKFGLYDMGGNVWQWCMDTWDKESKDKVLRGASWYNGALKLSLLSSCRVHAAPDSSTDNYGFRIVRATEAGKPQKK